VQSRNVKWKPAKSNGLRLSGGATEHAGAGLPLRKEETSAAERKGAAALWRHTAVAQKRIRRIPQPEQVRLEPDPVLVPALFLSYHSCKLGRNSLWKIQHHTTDDAAKLLQKT